jgi:hypothetical protein
MSNIDLDEKVGEHLCDACKIRKAKRRLVFSYRHNLYLCDICFDDIRDLMLNTFWIGSKKTREQLEKENPVVFVREKRFDKRGNPL